MSGSSPSHSSLAEPSAAAPRWPGRAFLALVLLALALLWPVEAPVDAAGLDAPEGEFSAARALRWLEERGPLEPRPGGSAAHAEFRRSIVAQLQALGLAVEVQELLARGPSGRVALVRNVVARQFPQARGRSVLLAAHYDSVGASPGAADDAAGCASLVEIARALTHGPPLERPLVYLFSDAEEAGLIGAEAFAAHHELASSVGCVVNLEARGAVGPSVMFQVRGGPRAIAAFARAAPAARASSLADLVYKLMPNDTDFSVFAERGVSGFNFAFLGGLWLYHTPEDTLERLAPASVQHQGEQVLALVREMAREPLEEWREAGVVFTDVAGLGVVAWPAWLGVLLASAALVVVLRRTRRDERSALRAIADVGPGVTAAIAVSLGVVWALFAGLDAALGSPDAGARAPDLAGLGLTLSSCGAFLLVAALVTRRTTFRDAWLALGATLAPLALVASIAISEASYLALAPLLAWCALEFALAPGRDGAALRSWSALAIFTALALLLWIPIRAQFWLALSFRMPVALACAPVATLGLAWPAFTLLSARALARCGAVSLGAGVLLLASTIAKLPGGSTGVEWLNLRYVSDLERDVSRFEASTFGARLPGEVARAARWSPATTPPFPWLSLDRSMWVAPAPRFDGPPPRLAVLDARPVDGGRRVRCRISSPRGAPRLHLHLPEEVALEALEWRGQRLEGGFAGVRTQLFFAVEPEGLIVELLDRAEQPSSVHLLDQDWAWTREQQALREARFGYTHVPRSDGDVVIVGARHVLW